MANNRIFYATQTVQLQPQNRDGSAIFNGWVTPLGIQSAGMTTNFNLEQVFTLGQLELYDNVENVPDIQVTLNKVIDGTMPLYLICMNGSDNSLHGANGKGIVELANNRVNFRLGIFADTNAAASGTPTHFVNCSGMYLSNFSYNIPVDGNSTEDITLVGNHKIWDSVDGGAYSISQFDTQQTSQQTARRYNFNYNASTLPSGEAGIRMVDGSGRPHVQSVKVSADLGREAIYELGKFAPYYRYVKFPLEVTSEFEITATDGDLVEANDFHGVDGSCGTSYKNLVNKTIVVSVCGSGSQDYLTLDLGDKNKLTSVNYTGGDTGGGNATITYSFQTWNHFVMTSHGSFADINLVWPENN
jgi:hypothetical protein